MHRETRACVLLLSATIDPGDTPMVARRDPNLRRRDYEQALRAWLQSGCVERIVFCENSNQDLGSLEAVSAAFPRCQVEFISFSGNVSDPRRGKGVGELNIIAHALSHSSLLSRSELVIKCSGRLAVRNAAALVWRLRATEFDIMCNLKFYLTFADSRLFAATPAFLADYLLRFGDLVNEAEGLWFEHALACAAASAIADRKVWRPFPKYPRFHGFSGTHGIPMTEGLMKQIGKSIYFRMRRLAYRY